MVKGVLNSILITVRGMEFVTSVFQEIVFGVLLFFVTFNWLPIVFIPCVERARPACNTRPNCHPILLLYNSRSFSIVVQLTLISKGF